MSNNHISSYKDGKIRTYTIPGKFSNKGLNSIIEDAKGNFWISENFEWYYSFNVQHLVIFNPKDGSVVKVNDYLGTDLAFHSVISGPAREIYISTKNGRLLQFDTHNKKMRIIKEFDNENMKLLYASEDKLYVCEEINATSYARLYVLNKSGQILSETDVHGTFLKSVFEVNNKAFYVYDDKHSHQVVKA